MGIVEENLSELVRIREVTSIVVRVDHALTLLVTGKNTHDHGAGTVSTLVLAEIVRTRELLATVGALERLVVSVERAVVPLEVLLTTEATAAESADEGLGRVVSE